MNAKHYTVTIDGYETRVDTPGGSWYPDAEIIPKILDAEDPTAMAIELCREGEHGIWAPN